MSRAWWIALVLFLAGGVFVDFFVPRDEIRGLWDYRTFYVWWGFLGTVAFVYLARYVGKSLLLRSEEYYRQFAPYIEAEEERRGDETDDRGEDDDVG